jgi:hypothetical protein
MATIEKTRRRWVLMNVHTYHKIILPPMDKVGVYCHGPSHVDFHYSWTDLVLLKVVICQVPTPSGNYTDFKLIALFNRGLAYLCGGAGLWWALLPSQPYIDVDS